MTKTQKYNTTFNTPPSKEEVFEHICNDIKEFIKSINKVAKDYRFSDCCTPQFRIEDMIFGPLCAGTEIRELDYPTFHTIMYQHKTAVELGLDKPKIDPIFKYIDFQFNKGARDRTSTEDGYLRLTYSSIPVVMDPCRMFISIGKSGKLEVETENESHYMNSRTTNYGASIKNMFLLIIANRDVLRGKLIANLQNSEAQYQDRKRQKAQRERQEEVDLANQYLIAQAQGYPF